MIVVALFVGERLVFIHTSYRTVVKELILLFYSFSFSGATSEGIDCWKLDN